MQLKGFPRVKPLSPYPSCWELQNVSVTFHTVRGRYVWPHSPLTQQPSWQLWSPAVADEQAVMERQTSCHQSDRRQLSPYIWRPPGTPHFHPPHVSSQVFFFSPLQCLQETRLLWLHAQGKVKSLETLLRKSAKQQHERKELTLVLWLSGLTDQASDLSKVQQMRVGLFS